MSIIYCEMHDLRWDSDKKERCPQCEADNTDIVSELTASLEAALRYIEVVYAYKGAMTAAEVEQAIKDRRATVIEICANSVHTLASFDFEATQEVIAKAKG